MTKSILEEAQRLVNGDRKDTYDGTDDTIVALWSAYLGVELTVLDYAAMMVLLKVARTKGKLHRDSWVDIAGYAEVGPRLWEAKQEPRKWDSIVDVPHNVSVVDKDGDVWHRRPDGWYWSGVKSWGDLHDYDGCGPFTEILGPPPTEGNA